MCWYVIFFFYFNAFHELVVHLVNVCSEKMMTFFMLYSGNKTIPLEYGPLSEREFILERMQTPF